MKKKIALTLVVFCICAFGIILQKSLIKNNEKVYTVQKEIKNNEPEESKDTANTNTNTSTSTSTSTSASASTNTEVKNTTEKAASSTQNKVVSANTNTNTNVNASTPVAETKNIYITDTISGKSIISSYINIEGMSVTEATEKVLNNAGISYRVVKSLGGVYFSSIGGIKERSEGSESGWCYYVNSKKPDIGASFYKLSKGDILEWKFLKNGL